MTDYDFGGYDPDWDFFLPDDDDYDAQHAGDWTEPYEDDDA